MAYATLALKGRSTLKRLRACMEDTELNLIKATLTARIPATKEDDRRKAIQEVIGCFMSPPPVDSILSILRENEEAFFEHPISAQWALRHVKALMTMTERPNPEERVDIQLIDQALARANSLLGPPWSE